VNPELLTRLLQRSQTVKALLQPDLMQRSKLELYSITS
jgi:hypothetical protein